MIGFQVRDLQKNLGLTLLAKVLQHLFIDLNVSCLGSAAMLTSANREALFWPPWPEHARTLFCSPVFFFVTKELERCRWGPCEIVKLLSDDFNFESDQFRGVICSTIKWSLFGFYNLIRIIFSSCSYLMYSFASIPTLFLCTHIYICIFYPQELKNAFVREPKSEYSF